jgi:hypothetical protein
MTEGHSLHDYFRSTEDVSDAVLLAHRQEISNEALAKLEQGVDLHLKPARTGALVRE